MPGLTLAPLRARIDGDEGYALAGSLSQAELATVKAAIERQWLARLEERVPALAERFAALGIERYHQLSDQVDHSALWPKSARILPASAVSAIRAMSVFRDLERELGALVISREEQSDWDEIYWRLVRPGSSSDVGPLHADAWFWDLGHGVLPPGFSRIKVWVAVATEPGRNGLRVAPGSHRREWSYRSERHGEKLKPVLDMNEQDLGLRLLSTAPGDVVVFHDRLVHGGALNQGNRTRVSFELTLFVQSAG